MINSITDFFENGIHNLVEISEDFAKFPDNLAEFIESIGKETNKLALNIIGETLTSRDQMIRESSSRKEKWEIVRTDTRQLITSLGTISFQKTLYRHKKTRENVYLLDQILPLSPHQRLTEDAEARLLKEAVQTSYRKAGEETCKNEEKVSKQTVKNLLHSLEFPEAENPKEKRVVDYLYIDADEDHIALQFQQKKGDLKVNESGYKNNGVLGKLVYVYEGIEKEAPKSKRHRLVNRHYFSGVYEGEMNKELWAEIEHYLETTYELSKVKKIYLNADGGSWIKSGKSRISGIVTVLDEFHMSKYLIKMSSHMLDEAEEVRKELRRLIRRGTKEEFSAYAEELAGYGETEKARERILKSSSFFLNNWTAARIRLTNREEIKGCSAEGHVSHVLSARMSSRPMGWSRRGADKMCHLRAYYLNGGDMLELVRFQEKEITKEQNTEERKCLSASEILASEKNRYGKLGKYAEAMRATLSLQTREKFYFQTNIVL